MFSSAVLILLHFSILFRLSNCQEKSRYQKDIPDINSQYYGRERILSELTLLVQLKAGYSIETVTLHTREDLECSMDARRIILDVAARDYGGIVSAKNFIPG